MEECLLRESKSRAHRRCSAFDEYIAQLAAIEGRGTNARHTAGNGNGGQAAAIGEGIVANTLHTLGDGNGGQTLTTGEGVVANALHTLGNGEGCHLFAIQI